MIGHPVRILITLPWAQRLGGAETMLQTVLDGAAERDHELELVFLEDGPWPAELRSAGFPVEVLSAGRLRQVHRWSASVARLASILRKRRPDLILNWAAKTQLYGAPAAVLAGMGDRVVWWQQLIPTGHWIDRCATLLPSKAVGCYSGAAARAQAELWPSRPTFVVAPGTPVPQGGAGRQAGAVERAGDASRADAVSRAGAASRAGDMSQAGDVPRAGAVPAPPDMPDGAVVVGIVGRLQPWKGQDRLLRAHALLRERGHSVHTLVVGGDAYGLSSRYAQSLPTLAAELGLSARVTFTGQVPDAGPYIDRMDILVNASDPEPFGIVLLEGMARGVAVVAVDSGGPAELIEHERTGLLADSGDPRPLADALEGLLDSPSRRRALGQAGRERFLRDFTDRAMRERFFGRLEALCAGCGPR